MIIWFLVSVLGLLAVVPVHFLSVEHSRLEQRFGSKKGEKIGAILGMISGWGFFIFLIGIWIVPQPRFLLPLIQEIIFTIPLLSFLVLQIPLVHLLLGILFIIPGALLGIKGVTEIGLKESETHRSERVITTGLYSRMRHPQYTGAIYIPTIVILLITCNSISDYYQLRSLLEGRERTCEEFRG